MKPRAYYQPYQSGLLLAQAFSPSKTPLLRMEHLRQLDFPISREISYAVSYTHLTLPTN